MLIVLKPNTSKILFVVYLPLEYNYLSNPSNDDTEFSTSKLITPCFTSILHFIVILSTCIITLLFVYCFIISAISANSYDPGGILNILDASI